MAQASVPFYDQFIGVDVVSPLSARTPASAQTLKNWMFFPSQSLGPRPGWKYKALNQAGGGYGLYVRDEDGMDETTKVLVGDRLYTVEQGSFTISYAGALPVSLAILYDVETSEWALQLTEDSTVVLFQGLGLGVDTLTPYTLTDLKAVIDSLVNFSATIVGDGTTPAAFLPTIQAQGIDGGSYSIEFDYVQVVRKPIGAPDNFTNHQAARDLESHRLATFLSHAQNLYIATEEDKPQKYDGRICYNMGMARGALTSATPTGAGSLTATWYYTVRYSHVDAKGNYIPGSNTDLVLASPSSDAQVDLVIPTLQTSSGYSTDYAKVNGNQGPVTAITVDSGHTLQIGDRVTLIDRSLSGAALREAVTRTVTNVGATSVTLDSAVTVLDNDIISQSLLIEIYRTKSGGARLYTVAIIPNDPSVTSVTYSDSVTDVNLGAEFFEPLRQPDPPPTGGVITAHQGLPIITRIQGSPNEIAWAEPDNLEGFNEAEGRRIVYSPKGGSITAIWSTISALEIFFPTSLSRFTGTLADGLLTLRSVSKALGCPHYNCIQQLDNGQLIWLSNKGPRQMGPGGFPQGVGIPWDSILRRPRAEDRRYILERSFVIDNPDESMCMFFLNCESESGGVYTNSFCEIWVFDYQLDAPRWVGPWTNMNMGGGAVVVDGVLSFVEKKLEGVSSTIVNNVRECLNRKDDFDSIDHSQAIPMLWKPGFEDLGNKFFKKTFESIRVYSADPQNVSGFTLIVGIEKNFSEFEVCNFLLTIGKGGAAEGWGFDPWGSFPWGHPQSEPTEERIPCSPTFDNAGNALRPTFKHETIYERPIISSFGLAVRMNYQFGYAKE